MMAIALNNFMVIKLKAKSNEKRVMISVKGCRLDKRYFNGDNW